MTEKIVGAAAEAGADLATCQSLGERVVRATASRGVTTARSLVGHCTTSLDMDGCPLTLTRSTTNCSGCGTRRSTLRPYAGGLGFCRQMALRGTEHANRRATAASRLMRRLSSAQMMAHGETELELQHFQVKQVYTDTKGA